MMNVVFKLYELFMSLNPITMPVRWSKQGTEGSCGCPGMDEVQGRLQLHSARDKIVSAKLALLFS